MEKSDERASRAGRQVVKLLPPISELQEKMENCNAARGRKSSSGKEKGSVVKRVLNRLYDEAAIWGVIKENAAKKY